MGAKIMEIQITNNVYKSFFPGQIIAGKVILNLTSPCMSKGLFLQFYGAARATWVHTKGKTHHIYRIREKYFDGNLYLFGSNNSEEMALSAGEHTYTFAFTLPKKLPPSFKGKVGKTEYFIKGTFHRSWRLNKKLKVPFIVKPLVDLRPFSFLALPQRSRAVETTGCCTSGPVKLCLVLNKSGYVPRELITFSAAVENQSGSKLEAYYTLKQTVEVATRGSRCIDKKTLLKNKLGDVPSRQSKQFTHEVSVPDVAPSGLPHCVLITVKYQLCLSAKGFCSSCETPCNVVIGTIPIGDMFQPDSASARGVPQRHTGRAGYNSPTNQTQIPRELRAVEIQILNRIRKPSPGQEDEADTPGDQASGLSTGPAEGEIPLSSLSAGTEQPPGRTESLESTETPEAYGSPGTTESPESTETPEAYGSPGTTESPGVDQATEAQPRGTVQTSGVDQSAETPTVSVHAGHNNRGQPAGQEQALTTAEGVRLQLMRHVRRSYIEGIAKRSNEA